nr:uncharacterized protein LOC120968899 [Aegilops tauschii subsp. strangulata]
MLAATSHAADVSKLRQSLEQADEELGRVKKQLEGKQGATGEVESLKNALTEARKKAATELAAREKHEAGVGEVQQELQDAILKSKFERKSIGVIKTKLHSRKHKNGDVYANKRKNERDNTKMSKMPRHNVKNNYGEKRKHLRRNVHSTTQVAPLPHATAIGANKKKHFAMKFKR